MYHKGDYALIGWKYYDKNQYSLNTVLMQFSVNTYIANWKCGFKDKSNNESTLAAYILIN